jgi:hypothetical protein
MAENNYHPPISVTVTIVSMPSACEKPVEHSQPPTANGASPGISARGSRMLDFLSRHVPLLKMVVDRLFPLP